MLCNRPKLVNGPRRRRSRLAAPPSVETRAPGAKSVSRAAGVHPTSQSWEGGSTPNRDVGPHAPGSLEPFRPNWSCPGLTRASRASRGRLHDSECETGTRSPGQARGRHRTPCTREISGNRARRDIAVRMRAGSFSLAFRRPLSILRTIRCLLSAQRRRLRQDNCHGYPPNSEFPRPPGRRRAVASLRQRRGHRARRCRW